jgi:hypothetical protein
MHHDDGSDRSLTPLVTTRRRIRGRGRDGESGQAMVEFALILLPLLLIVAGIIQFGIAINYWLDMQRIANQGARWAAVNCGQSAINPPAFNPCSPSLEETLRDQALTQGLSDSVCVQITYAAKTASPPYPGNNVGDPIEVRLSTEFDLVPILGVGSLELGADATMRMEQKPDDVAEASSCP